MNANKIIECERRSIDKILKMRLLPNIFKIIGFIIAITALISLIGLKISGEEMETLRFILRNTLLAGLLFATISRDKIEDELTVLLRRQANTLALVFGAGLAILQPFINFIMDNIQAKEAVLSDGGAVSTVLMMLLIHLCYFELFKKMR